MQSETLQSLTQGGKRQIDEKMIEIWVNRNFYEFLNYLSHAAMNYESIQKYPLWVKLELLFEFLESKDPASRDGLCSRYILDKLTFEEILLLFDERHTNIGKVSGSTIKKQGV